MDTELVELVQSIRNRCEIFLVLSCMPNMGNIGQAIFTLLEDLCVDAQTIATEYCAEKKTKVSP